MPNYHATETEGAHRRFEYEREIATVAQVAQTRAEHGWPRWAQLPRLDFAHLRGYGITRLPFASVHALTLRRFPASSIRPGYC